MLAQLRKLIGPRDEEAPSYPGIPDGVALYVVGDIHGCLEPLRRTMAAIDADRERTAPRHAGEIYLGDYVDRGPDSRGVLEALIERSTSRRAIFLKGNHDAMLEEFVIGRRRIAEWLAYGGGDTLRSYGASPEQIAADGDELRELVPRHHLDFLAACDLSFEVEDYFFAHAGVRPGVALHRQSPEDLMWIRDEFLNHAGSFGAVVVHGHTPVTEPEFRANRIGIDTGAYMTGRVTCLRIDGAGPRVLSAPVSGR